MPTGCTVEIGSNLDLTFCDFALRCARVVMQRDDPGSDLLNLDEEPSDYHAKARGKAKKELRRLRSLTCADVGSEFHGYVESERARAKRELAKRERLGDAYRRMIGKVDSWDPPTEEHVDFQTFMREQLSQSIEWDCDGTHCQDQLFKIERLSPHEWHARRVERAKRDVDCHEKEYEEEVGRVRGRNAWKRDLAESLGVVANAEGE